jgi:CubicO group peptidase (beta-lactamase class C family)
MEEPLARILDRLVARKDIAHAVLAVERGEGSFRWIGARGEASPGGAAMRADTPFFIASIDKLFNAAIILKLRERGSVKLEEPMVAHLPASVTAGLHRLDGIDYTNRITVRHLLSHTSGLPDWLEDYPKGGQSLVERLLVDGDR